MTAETYISSIESGQLYGLPLRLTSLTLPELLPPIEVSLLLPELPHFIYETPSDDAT